MPKGEPKEGMLYAIGKRQPFQLHRVPFVHRSFARRVVTLDRHLFGVVKYRLDDPCNDFCFYGLEPKSVIAAARRHFERELEAAQKGLEAVGFYERALERENVSAD